MRDNKLFSPINGEHITTTEEALKELKELANDNPKLFHSVLAMMFELYVCNESSESILGVDGTFYAWMIYSKLSNMSISIQNQ